MANGKTRRLHQEPQDREPQAERPVEVELALTDTTTALDADVIEVDFKIPFDGVKGGPCGAWDDMKGL